ncbi:MAG: F0F1 ATP synthase subunit C [Candidatus Eremiobacterota bacterium]
MDNATWVALVSMVVAGLVVAVGAIAPALAEGKAVMQALASMAQQPDEARGLSRTLFIGLAMIESLAIYCFVLAMILVFANPFWSFFTRGKP